MPGKVETVKVQRPLASNETSPPWLVYGKFRKHQRLLLASEVPPSVQNAMGPDVKAYFAARWNASTKAWTFGRRVKPEDW